MRVLLDVRPSVAAFAQLLDDRQTEHEEACGQEFGSTTTLSLAEGLGIGMDMPAYYRAMDALRPAPVDLAADLAEAVRLLRVTEWGPRMGVDSERHCNDCGTPESANHVGCSLVAFLALVDAR